jgi:hypothetical protein
MSDVHQTRGFSNIFHGTIFIPKILEKPLWSYLSDWEEDEKLFFKLKRVKAKFRSYLLSLYRADKGWEDIDSAQWYQLMRLEKKEQIWEIYE